VTGEAGGVGGRSWSAQAVSQHGGVVHDGQTAEWLRATSPRGDDGAWLRLCLAARHLRQPNTMRYSNGTAAPGAAGCDTGTARRLLMLVRTGRRRHANRAAPKSRTRAWLPSRCEGAGSVSSRLGRADAIENTRSTGQRQGVEGTMCDVSLQETGKRARRDGQRRREEITPQQGSRPESFEGRHPRHALPITLHAGGRQERIALACVLLCFTARRILAIPGRPRAPPSHKRSPDNVAVCSARIADLTSGYLQAAGFLEGVGYEGSHSLAHRPHSRFVHPGRSRSPTGVRHWPPLAHA
jgi:hypothetical protein